MLNVGIQRQLIVFFVPITEIQILFKTPKNVITNVETVIFQVVTKIGLTDDQHTGINMTK